MTDTSDELIEQALRHAITTMSNDDLSEPGTDKRQRHVERLRAMAEAADVIARLSADKARMDWHLIETAPKNIKVLAAYQNRLGKWRVVTACYHTHLPCEADGEYAPEGWYEESDSNETIYRTSEPPTHWRDLPDPPALQNASTTP